MAQIQRRKTISVKIGNVVVGGGAPVVVQSMTNTDTADVPGTIQQVAQLAQAGSELVLYSQFDEAANHNGGDLHFGPDGYLYVGSGDGGNRFGSSHPSGFNAVFADGSTRDIAYTIDLTVFRYLGNIADGQNVGDF